MNNIDEYQLGESSDELRITTREECAALTIALAAQAQTEIYIFSEDLEPDLYNSNAFIDAVRHMLGNDTNAKVSILVHDISRVVQRGHKLIDLSRRASSRVELRKLNTKYHHAFMVVDGVGMVDRRRAERFETVANFNDPSEARNLQRFFKSVWEKSGMSLEARALHV